MSLSAASASAFFTTSFGIHRDVASTGVPFMSRSTLVAVARAASPRRRMTAMDACSLRAQAAFGFVSAERAPQPVPAASSVAASAAFAAAFDQDGVWLMCSPRGGSRGRRRGRGAHRGARRQPRCRISSPPLPRGPTRRRSAARRRDSTAHPPRRRTSRTRSRRPPAWCWRPSPASSSRRASPCAPGEASA